MSKARQQAKRTNNPNKGRPKWATGNPKQSSNSPIEPPSKEEELKLSDNDTLPQDNAPSAPPQATDISSSANMQTSVISIDEAPNQPLLDAEQTGVEENSSINSKEKKEKRAEPQNLPDFLSSFYLGKTKTLSATLAKRLVSIASDLEAGIEGDLLRQAQETDRNLEKTRKLMLLATEIQGHPALKHQITSFCKKLIVLNPDISSSGIKALLFPEFEDETSLEEAWRALLSLRLTKRTDVATEILTSDAPSMNSEATDSEKSKSKAQDKEGNSTPRTNIIRAQRNALLCSAIWRMQIRGTTFSEILRSLRSTIFALQTKPQSLEVELFESIATLPEKEDERFGYLLEWSSRLQTESVQKVKAAERQEELLRKEISAIQTQLQSVSEHASTLECQLDAEREARAAADRAIGVAETHGQADLEEMRALALIAIRDAISQLDVVAAALGRDHPKVDSARDKVHAVMDVLKNTSGKLEEV